MDFHDYGIRVLDKKLTNFDSTFSQSYRIGFNRILSPTLLVSTGVSNGLLWNDRLESSQLYKNYALGFDATAIFMSNNGKIFRQNAPFSPYITFGYQYYYIHKLKKQGFKPNDWSVQYGLGFNLNLQKRLSFQMQSALNQQLGNKYTTHFIHRIGFTHLIDLSKENSSMDSKPDPKPRDYDQDGIADNIDKCPTLAGEANTFGCPKGFLEKQARTMAKLDSMETLLLKLKTKMEHLDADMATLKKIKEQKKSTASPYEPDMVSKPKPSNETKVEPKTLPTTPSDDIEIVRESTNSYYIVTISALNEPYAVAEAQKIKAEYPNVKVLAQPNGFFRTAIYSGTDKTEAIKLLERVTNNGTKQAWIAYY
jgi:hypothetical protein